MTMSLPLRTRSAIFHATDPTVLSSDSGLIASAYADPSFMSRPLPTMLTSNSEKRLGIQPCHQLTNTTSIPQVYTVIYSMEQQDSAEGQAQKRPTPAVTSGLYRVRPKVTR